MNLQTDDFELFGLPRQFTQDRSVIDARWIALQREAHPDQFAAQGAAAQRISMQWSIRINEAYQRLRDPLKRAAYLCELAGSPINAHTNTAMSAAFLMQQMEWREALDEATTVEAVQELDDGIQATKHQLLKQCADFLDIAQDPASAVTPVRALMFIEKFALDVVQKMDRLQ